MPFAPNWSLRSSARNALRAASSDGFARVRLKTLASGPINPGDMPSVSSKKRTQLVGVASAIAGMAFVPAVVGAKTTTVDWARRALHVAARADAMARKPIDSARIKNGAVKSVDIGTGAVNTPDLKDGSVTGPKLADGAVAASKIAPGAVGDAQLADGAVTARTLAPGTVGADSLTAGSIGGGKLADGS